MPEIKDSRKRAGKWAPFVPDSGKGRPVATDRVTLQRTGQIRLSEDIVARLGTPSKIQLLTNGDRNAFAVCPAESPAGAVALSRQGRQHEFRATRLFTTMDRDAGLIVWPLDLPHSWEGDLLVIDVSEVPAQEPRP